MTTEREWRVVDEGGTYVENEHGGWTIHPDRKGAEEERELLDEAETGPLRLQVRNVSPWREEGAI